MSLRPADGPAVRWVGTALVVLLVATALVRLVLSGVPVTAEDFVPLLLGVAGLCVLGLAGSRSPSTAWLACVFVALMAAASLGPVSTHLRSVSTGAAGLLRLSLVAPVAIAAAYATRPGRLLRPWVPLVAWGAVAAIGATAAAGVVQLAVGTQPDAIVGIPRVAWGGALLAVVMLGAAGDVEPAAARVRARLAADPDPPRGPVVVVRLLVEELVPGRAEARAEAAEMERARIASDLHAEILPSLRRALVAAERQGSLERLAADLRESILAVEGLLLARRSIVLEELGLVAALEWLAERIEDGSDVRVELEVEADGAIRGAAEARAPRVTERAAFRVGQLALDNVVRHAHGASATVTVRVEPDAVYLQVRDEGPGIGDRARARDGGRGLADMAAEARSCGGSLEVTSGDGGTGTAVTFRWPA